MSTTEPIIISYEELIADSRALARSISKKYTSVYGIPNGGILPGFVVAEELGLPFVERPQPGTLVVDELVDSGRTLRTFGAYDTAVLYRKAHSPQIATYCLREYPANAWINLPHEKPENPIEENVVRIIQFLGGDASVYSSPEKIKILLEKIRLLVTQPTKNF